MKEFDRLVEIIKTLRAPGGCPWDAEQNHASIAPCAVEEAYELLEAIESDDPEHIKEELGDVLLQAVFHSEIARDEGRFGLEDVLEVLNSKLVSRHPHVFGDTEVADSKEVKRNWDELKKQEKTKQDRESILDGLPKDLPALMTAKKLQSRAAKVGFDWPDVSGVIDKVKEEADELQHEINEHNYDLMEAEIGDLLFSIVNLARFCKVDPERALRRTNAKFRQRFSAIERAAGQQGRNLSDMSLGEMDAIWEAAKKN